jgi:hypothetical protein
MRLVTSGPDDSTARMFSDEAWEAGWARARSLGLAESFAPLVRPATMRDVEEIVSAVVNHGFEELYAEQLINDAAVPDITGTVREDLSSHMREVLALKAIRNGCVMLALPREVTDHPERGVTRIRFIVPVRRARPR